MRGSILFSGLVILASLMIASISLACSPEPPNLNKTDNLPQAITTEVQNMMVAPNQSKIRARVLRINQSPQFKDKWNLEIEILTIEPIQGGTFAEAGQTVQVFTISEKLLFKQNDVISAEAEYLGDFTGGTFQLTQVKVEQ
jgi:hypothetical protein